MNAQTIPLVDDLRADLLTRTIRDALARPARTPDFDLHGAVGDVLKDVGLSIQDGGGKLAFRGRDPIIPSALRFGSVAAIGLAAKAVAVAATWRQRSGEGQDIEIDVRKAIRRFAGFFDRKWETLNGRAPILDDGSNPFHDLPLFRETRDGRQIVALNIYPRLCARALTLLNCANNSAAVSL